MRHITTGTRSDKQHGEVYISNTFVDTLCDNPEHMYAEDEGIHNGYTIEHIDHIPSYIV